MPRLWDVVYNQHVQLYFSPTTVLSQRDNVIAQMEIIYYFLQQSMNERALSMRRGLFSGDI